MCFWISARSVFVGVFGLDWIGLIVTMVTGSEIGGRRVLGSMKGDEKGGGGIWSGREYRRK